MQTTYKLEGGGGQKSRKFANVIYECPLSEGYLVPCLKCNNDSHRGYYLDGVFFKKTIVAINRTVFSQKFQGGY